MKRDFDIKVEPYKINGTEQDWLYFLVDGIYPGWSIFVKTISNPFNKKEKEFSKMQEYARKDVERAFGVLVQRFGVLDRKIRKWYVEDIVSLLHCCTIIHNTIVEERRSPDPFPHMPDADPLVADAAVEQPSFSLFGNAQPIMGQQHLPDIHLVQCTKLFSIAMLMTYYVMT
jgi:Plant transposon protein